MELVADLPLTAVYSSPLLRAVETARFVADAHDLTVRVHDGLRELSVGELEGRSDDAAFALLDEVYAAWTKQSRLDVTVGPGGESARQILERSMGAVEEIVAAESGGTALIVAHSGVLQNLIPALCDNLAADFGILNCLRNCQLVRVETDGTLLTGMTCRSWGGLDVLKDARQRRGLHVDPASAVPGRRDEPAELRPPLCSSSVE